MTTNIHVPQKVLEYILVEVSKTNYNLSLVSTKD